MGKERGGGRGGSFDTGGEVERGKFDTFWY